MEKMQEALKGKNRVHHPNVIDCMPSDTECSFSSDSLDDRALRDESSQRDSSTVISEFSSTKTLMNIGDDDIRLPFDESEVTSKKFLSRRYSDSFGTKENIVPIQYSWQIDVSQEQAPITSHLLGEKNKDISSILDMQNEVALRIKHQENKQNISKTSNTSNQSFSMETKYIAQKKVINELHPTPDSFSYEDIFKKQNEVISTESKKKKIVLDFNEFPPLKYERKIQEHSDTGVITSTDDSRSSFYLSSIKEKCETSSVRNQNNLNAKINKIISEEMIINPTYDYKRKYHTYPKSRIPVLKCTRKRRIENYAIDPRMFPLEPREIDLDSFQQLHTADSQEELQEFLLLESQCSGNLGLASNAFTSEVFYSEYTDDERGTMSGRTLFKTNDRNVSFTK